MAHLFDARGIYGGAGMKPVLDTIEFFHAMRSQMRFGEFSRLPIEVHRFMIEGGAAECDWFMRRPDPWDAQLPPRLQQEHRTQQALHDALKIRELIFRASRRLSARACECIALPKASSPS